MIRSFLIPILVCVPCVARADFDLSQLVGTWIGTGRYIDGAAGGKLRCRMSVQGQSAEIVLQTRCASGAGSGTSTLRLRRAGAGTVSATVEAASQYTVGDVMTLDGRPEQTWLILTGETGNGRAKMILRLESDDMLYVAGEYVRGQTRQASTVDFERQ